MSVTIKDFEVTPSFTRTLTKFQLAFVANWITESGELPLISGSTGKELLPDELKFWFESAIQGIIVEHEGKIIGIATLTRAEAPIPQDAVELCHCIVHPNYRRLYNGSSMIILLSAFAKQNGYRKVVGRVAKSNPIGRTLLQYLHWHMLSNVNYSNEDSVIWLGKMLEKHGR